MAAGPAEMPGVTANPAAAAPPADAVDRGPKPGRRTRRHIRTLMMFSGALVILVVIAMLASRKARPRR